MARPNKKRFNLNTRQINFIKKKLEITKIEDVDVATLKLLKEKLKSLQDIRIKKKTKFKLWDIIICTILAVLFVSNSWEEVHDFVEENYLFFRKFLLMTGGIPCQKNI